MDLFSEEFKQFFKVLSKHKVDVVLVGGMAVVLHGYNRFTEDIDLFFYPSNENGINLLSALDDFGFDTSDFKETDFTKPLHFRLYEKESYFDLLNATVGISIEDLFKNALLHDLGDVSIRVIHINHLIQNKIAMNTSKDTADAEALIKIRDKK